MMIRTFLLGKEIANLKLPERLDVLDGMPVTPTRKVIQSRLRPPGPSPPSRSDTNP